MIERDLSTEDIFTEETGLCIDLPPTKLIHNYDDVVSMAWKLRANGQEVDAELLLSDNGIPSDNILTDGK